MYHVYVIYNKDNDKAYTGQTIDLEQRLIMHNDRLIKSSYTSRFSGDWELIHKEIFSSRQEALRREKQLKSYQGRQFIKNINRP